MVACRVGREVGVKDINGWGREESVDGWERRQIGAVRRTTKRRNDNDEGNTPYKKGDKRVRRTERVGRVEESVQ